MRNQLFVGAAIAALMIPAAASAQETTSIIRGTITSNGTPVSGATLVITHVPSGTVSRASTDSSGGFSASGLRSGGPYTVDVTSDQGATQITDIYAVVGQPYDLPIDVSESTGADIIVTASSIRGAGATSDGPQTVLNATDIAKVASVNRDIRDIERRSPFASIDLTNGRAVSFAGTNPRFNRFTINGAQVGDTFGLNPDASPTRRGPIPFDAIGQVSVSIAPFDIRQTNFQGGVVDATLASGTNEYHVNGFYSQSTDGLQGDNIQGIKINLPKYKSETYGATASGPIIKDKLFIAGSYERNTDPRPLTPGSVAQVPNLTQAALTQIQQIAQQVYNYNTGDILQVTNNLDEKFSVKLDWNITDGQRFSFSYVNSFDAQDNPQNSSTSTTTPSIGLASNAYKLTELLRVGIAQLNSDWTDRFSTEARFSYKSYTRGQDPELGRGFAQFIVCTAPTSVVDLNQGNQLTSCGTGNPTVAFGPDISRQTNALFTDTYDGSFLARFKAGNHDFKALFQYVENRTTNAFLQRSAGAYYFDSIADLQNRTASQFDYANALTLNPEDTTASFRYGEYSVGIQDDWQLRPNLRVTGGLRYNLYASADPVGLNNSFVARYSFPNTNTFNGLQSFEPRLSFDWKPVTNLNVRGGVGIFAAGTPDIYFSNSYSNTGANQNRIAAVIRATPTGGNVATCTAPYTGANAAICTAALNNVQGAVGTIPTVVNNFLSTNIGSLATANTASVDNRFRIPSQTRATLSADYRFFGVDFGVDYLFSRVNSAVTFVDLRSTQIGTLPDGRPRYSFVRTPGVAGQTVDTNSDIQITNTRQGRSHIFVLRAEKEFKNLGLTLGGSYTWQDVKDVSNATSSVAASLYNAQAVIDPNNAAYGRSSDEIKWQFKYSIGYDHAWFRDYRTIIQLFGETRAGRPFSFTANDSTSGRSAVFGTLGNTNHYLLYVPTSTTDPLVSYGNSTSTVNGVAVTQTAAQAQAFLDTLINNTNLKNYRGAIADKNIARSRANTRIDLHLEQEIPTFIGKSRISLYADIENLPNLLNRNWGGVTQLGFPATSTTVQVACLNAAVPNGVPVGNIGAAAPAGGVSAVNTNSSQPCAQYRYTAVRDASQTLTTDISLYLIRLGVRVKF